MVKIAPSILSADFSCLEREIRSVEEAEMIHVDVMDGHFVPNITFGPLVVKALRKLTDKPLDVHLMIENPEKYINAFAEAGADIITIHAEACDNVEELVRMIKDTGCKVGVSIKPKTEIEVIEHILDKVDLILVMTVEPGFGGQKLIESVLPKITKLKEIIKSKNLNVEIEVDGGINKETCSKVVEAGADILVAGSAIFKNDDHAKALKEIKSIVDKIKPEG